MSRRAEETLSSSSLEPTWSSLFTHQALARRLIALQRMRRYKEGATQLQARWWACDLESP